MFIEKKVPNWAKILKLETREQSKVECNGGLQYIGAEWHVLYRLMRYIQALTPMSPIFQLYSLGVLCVYR